MHRFLALLVLTFWSVPAMAEPVLIRSGEHGSFTRLVAKVATKGQWSVQQDGRKVIFQLQGYSGGFDTSQVFEFIPRHRVKQVEADHSTLTIHLGCDCDVAAFDVAGGYVALDIAYPPPSRRPPNLRHPSFQVNSGPETKNHHNQSKLAPRGRPPWLQLNKDEQATLTELQSRLSAEIGKAATRGLLSATQNSSAQIDTSVFDTLLPLAPLSASINQRAANIRITTSMDAPEQPDLTARTLSDQGQWCPPDDLTNIPVWADIRPFDIQISEARSNLFGEFDQLDPGAAMTLARKYIYFGFGAEARQVLSLNADLAAQNQELMGIAEILEANETTPQTVFNSLADCTGNISLWVFLADQRKQSKTDIDPAAILLTLSNLPVDLRRYLAPIVGKRLLTQGDPVSAATALRSIERTAGSQAPSASLVRAGLGLSHGQTEESARILADIASANVAESPDALVSLINSQTKQNEPVDPGLIELANAYTRELQGTPVGDDLQKAYVLALINIGDFDTALAELTDLESTGGLAIKLRGQLFQELAAAADDIKFLDVFFRQSKEDLALLDAQTTISLASRLLALGFAKKAQTLVDAIPDRPRSTRRQELSARIALAMDQPMRALVKLIGVETDTSSILRAEANNRVGAYEEAHRILREVGQPVAAARSAWLANSWQDLVDEETPIFGPLATLAKSPAEIEPDYTGMLSKTEAAIKESSKARQIIMQFLDEQQLHTPPQ